jgi:hypothetical protein
MKKIKHPKGGRMKRNSSSIGQEKVKLIDKVVSTRQSLTGRAGLALALKYVENTDILSRLSHKFKHLKLNNKGLQVNSFFKQILANMIDGSKLDLVVFDELRNNSSYAQLLEMRTDDLASSHQIKRMFYKFKNQQRHIIPFREVLNDLFISHLRSEKPEVIVLGVDTMVMDNDKANQREGCSPTYKKVKGFQPLEFYGNGMIIDAIFREGKCHSNHGNDVKEAMKNLVKKIRKGYSEHVPIILKMDSGFMSEENFDYFEKELGILFISAGKMYQSIKDYIGEIPSNNRKKYYGSHTWDYIEFGSKLQSWKEFRRTIYLQQDTEETIQPILDFAKSDSVIYTNIGKDAILTDKLVAFYGKKALTAEFIISEYHKRGQDELCNRAFKDFVTRENLPFQGFAQNQAFYYLLVIAYTLLQSYVLDVFYDNFYHRSYPTTLRRLLIDFAGKFVFHARTIILQVAEATFNKLNLGEIWERCKSHNRKLMYI